MIELHEVSQRIAQAETWSASDNIKSQLLHDNAVSELEDLMNQIFARRTENVAQIPCILSSRNSCIMLIPLIQSVDISYAIKSDTE